MHAEAEGYREKPGVTCSSETHVRQDELITVTLNRRPARFCASRRVSVSFQAGLDGREVTL